MQGLIGIARTNLKHAAIPLATGLLLPLATFQSGAQIQPKRPRITGIAAVRLYVSDLGNSIDFYTRTLGLAPSGGNCISSPIPFFPVNAKQQIEVAPAFSPAPKNWVAEIVFATDDIAGMHRYLLAHGTRAGAISSEQGGAKHFKVRDPEGNPIAFIQRPELNRDFVPINTRIGARLIHACFVVKDIASENRFYVDLLGFKLYWYGGFKDDGVDWYEIQVPDGPDWIEYMLNIPANADHKELGVQNHFSLGVKDANAAAAQLRKNGLQQFDGPEIGRDGKNSLDAYDPDGTRVEIMEFTPTQKPCCHPYTAPHPTP
jgi:catechol 2,3-dioxygenase-like lactoylglutathione lyase family enzyme